MAIHVALSHITHYRYDRLVKLGPQVVRLRPAPHSRTKVLSYSQKIEPAGHFINWQQDPFANYQARLVFPEPTTEFKVTIDLVVEMAVHNPFDFFLEPRAEEFPFSYDASQLQELAPYLATAPLTEELKAYLAQVDMKKRRTIDFLVDVNQMLQRDISYTIRMEPGVQTPEETLQLKSGSCRDTGWLLVQMLRHLGLAARFVSGYLIQLTPDVKAIDGPSGPEKDFTDLHAWCEVFLPGAGWIGLDPTSGLLAGEGHIPLACTPQPSSAAPVEGAMDKCEVEFEHHMGVTRVYESPRVTKPYTEEQWAGVVALGEKVDADLEKHDVRLTMGGEPTYVATADRDAAEWNTDALGPTKRGYATELLGRLRERYGAGGFVHMGQGKWYPGEQLPRWALSIFWRADGEPCWNNPALLADERDAAKYDSEDASRFTQALARQLGLSTQFITPGFEDTWYYLWRERRLPVNVDPFDAKLDDELERARLRRVFTQGLDATVGYVLPLMANDHIPLSGNGKGGEGYHRVSGTVWSTGPWFFRDERMYLVPGDSPMGYRLPLDSLPWVSAADYPYHIEQDPHTPRDPLPAGTVLKHQVSPHSIGGGFAEGGTVSLQGTDFDPAGGPAMDGQGTGRSGPGSTPTQALSSRFPQRHESAAWLTRTALVVEARDPHRANGPKAEKAGGGKNQHLYVFMPPMQRLEDYLDLLSAVEATADQLGMTIVLEGYPPPRDPRLKMLQVTPDPGVIEVNIHPSSSWPELVERTEFLYDAAFETRLCAEKFMTDGRHTGTGGGNHFVLGGATPADSPFLRRPELLGSLVAYWHNHPSLSYLFSGLFIGPTSQAPRVDEARNDQLYELEIALQEIEKNRQTHGQDMPPWLVDRTLRNILIDVTGNTHRSEFCIDKLFSPDSPTGRLGLLELRAFEMPPHARMSIAQQLLLRAMVSRFWQKPWSGKLTRWGTELHDRYLLPTFIRMDFEDVLAELAEFGYPLDMAWFEPHFEFRFPLVGEVSARGIELTLRSALEPWHVMGEEGAPGGTVRYVDSSLERIEVRVSGYNDSRYVITCNGRAIPMQSTGTVGEFVSGVRYKAWSPPSALHPSIPSHAPLTFDIVDTWMQRSLGGCQYHVAHPGGRNYDTFPINAYEAESRRMSRFFQMGHTAGKMVVAPAAPSREFPFTLDLRH
ncbi:MAG TPA: IMP dehydrogenase [Hydrogenophaga sp.]|uniref:transglutaminase family protein n=1 Tax=Hydrogenophaga sp. TaxID=1904254 RepID=UPI0008C7DEE7|nr:transglutaminase family protein [Hydrogenophaga sp.]MBU4183992.1 transglutaminase family protein [Gammaproteobacteria bacterium]OGA77933.1 MAG: IMP dehydrogenase [Burkholderiales bacterium GWE1_65_30]OGA94282.1 MAG: IMP dehydrogenase [Burkholderiales bacterium GWF1_66_17]MBU4283038.1 transglutaminase family protein [Gammaproteobacteria bacterium]MBU4324456.1 transglutaminase family protein [Gammaproteobacteria bacterium]